MTRERVKALIIGPMEMFMWAITKMMSEKAKAP